MKTKANGVQSGYVWDTTEEKEKAKIFPSKRITKQDASAKRTSKEAIERVFKGVAEQSGMDERFIRAIGEAESDGSQYNKDGTVKESGKGAAGRMQVTPIAIREVNRQIKSGNKVVIKLLEGEKADWQRVKFDEEHNIRVGTAYLYIHWDFFRRQQLVSINGKWRLVRKPLSYFKNGGRRNFRFERPPVAAYNSGPKIVIESLQQHGPEWYEYLYTETKGHRERFLERYYKAKSASSPLGSQDSELVDKILHHYMKGTLTVKDTEEKLLNRLGLNTKKLDQTLLNIARDEIRKELGGIKLKGLYEGCQAIVYEGILDGTVFIAKEMKENELGDAAWQRYELGENILGDLAAGYILIRDLKVIINGKKHNIRRAVIQNRVTPLFEVLTKLKNEGKTNEISREIYKFIEFYKTLIEMRILGKISGFLANYSLDQTGHLVVLDVGDLDFEIVKNNLREVDLNNFPIYIMMNLMKSSLLWKNGQEIIIDPIELIRFGLGRIGERICEELSPVKFKELWQRNENNGRVTYFGGYEIAKRIKEKRELYLRSIIGKSFSLAIKELSASSLQPSPLIQQPNKLDELDSSINPNVSSPLDSSKVNLPKIIYIFGLTLALVAGFAFPVLAAEKISEFTRFGFSIGEWVVNVLTLFIGYEFYKLFTSDDPEAGEGRKKYFKGMGFIIVGAILKLFFTPENETIPTYLGLTLGEWAGTLSMFVGAVELWEYIRDFIQKDGGRKGGGIGGGGVSPYIPADKYPRAASPVTPQEATEWKGLVGMFREWFRSAMGARASPQKGQGGIAALVVIVAGIAIIPLQKIFVIRQNIKEVLYELKNNLVKAIEKTEEGIVELSTK
ncbi:MAG: transglycosylase SLT domain-containing protein, partial [Candidatus Omnitrophica bacterium]|nr:transglycosylase SLT domain-containing protein [Candidatus Omnitrophota bacterium]